MKYLYKYLILVVTVMPFLAPSEVSIMPLLISPAEMKTALGVFLVTSGLFIWLLISFKNKKIYLCKTPIYWPIFGFLIWCFTTLLWIENGYLAVMMLTQFTVAGLIFLLIVNLVENDNQIDVFFKFIVISLALISIIGLLQYYFSEIWFIKHIFAQITPPAATFGNKNMASHFLVMVIPLGLVFVLSSKDSRQIVIYGVLITISLWFLIYTTARQAYIAISVELLILLLFFALDE